MKPSNNCETCKHKKNPQGGHCYMFREEPDDTCYQHTDFQAAKKRVLDTRHRSVLDNASIRLAQIKCLLNGGIGASNHRLVTDPKQIAELIDERAELHKSAKLGEPNDT